MGRRWRRSSARRSRAPWAPAPRRLRRGAASRTRGRARRSTRCRMNPGLEAARAALAGQRAWLVGGAVRDRALGRATPDMDVIVEGDSARAAREVARVAGGAACFSLSEDFGAWRVVARDRSWQVDVEPLRADSLEADLALRDFTVNAIAEPIAGGQLIDPLGGLADLDARRLRIAAPDAF